MGNIGGHSPDLFAWHKLKLGWLDADQMDCVTAPGTTEHTLTPVETAGGKKLVVVRTGTDTAYAVESRRATGLDAEACDTGPLVYSIDSPLQSGMGPVRVIDATPGSPQTSRCRDADRGTLHPGGSLMTPDGVRFELVAQTADTDTVRVTRPATTEAGVGGTVPPTLALTVGDASFGAFTPGLDKEYTAGTTATVTSSAGDATLSVSDPGHLANGSFTLPEPLRVQMSKTGWSAPVSNDSVAIAFSQHIGAADALRTGTYTKGLTFSLSTTTP
jgi:hypothetical protein